jgi:hypothetical protein
MSRPRRAPSLELAALVLAFYPWAQASAAPGSAPVRYFEANEGQADPSVRYLARGPGYVLLLGESAVFMKVAEPPKRPLAARFAARPGERPEPRTTALIRMRWRGGRRAVPVSGRGRLPGVSHYLRGNDPAEWRRDVPHFTHVEYRQIYPGIDLVWHARRGRPEYDLVVAPGADPRAIRLEFEGARGVRVEGEALVLETDAGNVVQLGPIAHQAGAGGPESVPVRYAVRSGRDVRFEIGSYDRSRELVIDPELSYASYLGGTGADYGLAAAVDGGGNAYLAGMTLSLDFPTVNPRQPDPGGDFDAFVAKFDRTGSALVYATYVGGSSEDHFHGAAADASGNAYLAGYTLSPDFPTANALQPSLRGSGEAVVVKLNPRGSSFVYSTYLGGSGLDIAFDIVVDGAGAALLTGGTGSPNFPTVEPYQAALAGGFSDAFVTKVNPAGSALVYSTYLGGSGGDVGQGIAVDGWGRAYVTGYTESANFPTRNPVQAALAGRQNAFVTRLEAPGSSLGYSTFLGGSNVLGDQGIGIAVDGSGSACVTGETTSSDFPTANAVQPTLADFADGFVAKLDPSGSTLVYSTYLGGVTPPPPPGLLVPGDRPNGIALDAAGNAYVAGTTGSANFPTVNAVQPALQGVTDAFLSKLRPDGSLAYSTYLGGSAFDNGEDVAADAVGTAYVVGTTSSVDLPVPGDPVQPVFAGEVDAFLTRVAEPLPALRFYTVAPCRVVDTRLPPGPTGGPALAGHTTRGFPIAGACGIPVTARAVSATLAVTGPTSAGHLTFFAAATPEAPVATINYGAGQTRSNNAVAPLGQGFLAVRCVQPSGGTHFVLDVNGYFE